MTDDAAVWDQRRRQYEVERELAARLRQSTREQRAAMYGDLYDELFTRVPDHPRLVRRETPEERHRAVAARMRLLEAFLATDTTFLEFAPGDCRLAFAVAARVAKVYTVDISDQSGTGERPDNVEMIVYDGFCLDFPDASADLVFSYQFLEHLHPDDTALHFQTVHRILRPGGRYVFSTPHAFSGPHDVSGFFSDEPEGFHLKEWTYRDMVAALKRAGFSHWYTFRFGRPRDSHAVTQLTLLAEAVARCLPRRLQRRVCRRAFDSVTMVARK